MLTPPNQLPPSAKGKGNIPYQTFPGLKRNDMKTFANISVKYLKTVKSSNGISWDVYQTEKRTPIGVATSSFVARAGKKRKAGEVIKLSKLVLSEDECPKLVDAEV